MFGDFWFHRFPLFYISSFARQTWVSLNTWVSPQSFRAINHSRQITRKLNRSVTHDEVTIPGRQTFHNWLKWRYTLTRDSSGLEEKSFGTSLTKYEIPPKRCLMEPSNLRTPKNLRLPSYLIRLSHRNSEVNSQFQRETNGHSKVSQLSVYSNEDKSDEESNARKKCWNRDRFNWVWPDDRVYECIEIRPNFKSFKVFGNPKPGGKAHILPISIDPKPRKLVIIFKMHQLLVKLNKTNSDIF